MVNFRQICSHWAPRPESVKCRIFGFCTMCASASQIRHLNFFAHKVICNPLSPQAEADFLKGSNRRGDVCRFQHFHSTRKISSAKVLVVGLLNISTLN